MREPKPQFLKISNDGVDRSIAYLRAKNEGTGLVWLPGFYSSMESTKASTLAEWGPEEGFALTRFDYFAHGKSEGRREDGKISLWLNDAIHILSSLTTGPQILIGSSMGGWIALLLLRHVLKEFGPSQEKIAAIVMIAPAWDMTQNLIRNRLDEEAKRKIDEDGVFYAPSDYVDEPHPITKVLIEDGDKHLLAPNPFDPKVPIRILHGMKDPDVPWQNSMQLMEILNTEDIVLSLIKDGDHRLSRDQDIERLKRELIALRDNT